MSRWPLEPLFIREPSPCVTSLRWKQWSGYFVAVAYNDFHDPEYHAIRTGAGLIDVSPLYKYDIEGPDAERLVDRLITRDASKCQIGQVLYAAWCDEGGKVIQDGCFQRLAKDHFRASAADQSLVWFRLNAEGMNVQVEDVSEKYAALALQGPRSREILKRIWSKDLSKLGFFRLGSTELDGVPAVVTRTGYTGDLGYEIWADAAKAEKLWDAVVGRRPRSRARARWNRRARPRAPRGGLSAHRRRLLERGESVRRGTEVVSLRDQHGLGGEPQEAALHREARAHRRAEDGHRAFSRRHRGDLPRDRASLLARDPRAPAHERGLAGRRPRVLRRTPGGKGDLERLVHSPQEVHRSRDRRPRLRELPGRRSISSSPSST